MQREVLLGWCQTEWKAVLKNWALEPALPLLSSQPCHLLAMETWPTAYHLQACFLTYQMGRKMILVPISQSHFDD